MVNIDTIVSSVTASLGECSSSCLVVFWLQDDGDREQTCRELTAKLVGTRVIPHVLRQPIFRDPNAWAGDAMAVVESLKDRVLQFGVTGDDAPLGLIIISRSKLSVSQSSSPATAPQWLPGIGGQEVMVFARDVQAIAACSLASEDAALPAIKTMLYQLESALLNVARAKAGDDRHHGQRLWGELLKERTKLARRSEFTDYWARGIDSIKDPESYRPSLAFGWSMVAAMWHTFLSASPSQLLAKSEAFVEFFGIKASWLPMEPEPSALLPIMFRGPDDRENSEDVIAGRGLILTVGLACQLTTAAAHADQYGRVSAVMLSAVSRELRRALAAAERQALWDTQTL